MKETETYSTDSLGEWQPGPALPLCACFPSRPSWAQRVWLGVWHSTGLGRLKLTLLTNVCWSLHLSGVPRACLGTLLSCFLGFSVPGA